MRQHKILFIILLLAIAKVGQSQVTIEVTNQYPFDRVDEIIEVQASDFNGFSLSKNLILKDSTNKEIPYQLIYSGTETAQSIVFPVNVKTGTKAKYTLSSGTPKAVKAKTYACFVPERKDDFAWENDLAAYRMFGPASADENTSDGVELWLKRTDTPTLNSFYEGELKQGKPYNIDHGQGINCYTVGHTLGAGGVAPYVNGELMVGNHFDSYEILDNGPLRSTFKLIYNNVDINGKAYTKEIIISTSAGSILNKAIVKFIGEKQDIQLATGIFLHNGKGALQKAPGLMVYGEDAIVEKTQENVGKHYVGLVLPEKEDEYKIQKVTALYINNYTTDNVFTYYFGGGWSKWKFPTQKEWLAAVRQFANEVRYPVAVKIIK
ncbi:DUF4861 domain-containing protein [Paludibacter sp.]